MKVSAIVTSYNHAEYLDQRMQSLMVQSHQPLEIIVVDDCSKDNSIEVLEKYKIYPNVSIIALEKNQGYANACNVGASMATGHYIIFSECDDYCEPDQIKTLVNKFIENSSIGVAFSSSNIVDSQGSFLRNDFIYRDKNFKAKCSSNCILKSEEVQVLFAASCVIPNMSAAMIKREVFFSVGGLAQKYKICADWDFWCRISRICDFFYIREPLNNFRTHPTSVGSLSRMDQRGIEIIELIYDHNEKMNRHCRSRARLLFVVGDVLIGFFSSRPFRWIRAFPAMYSYSVARDKLNIIAPLIGLGRKVLTKLLN